MTVLYTVGSKMWLIDQLYIKLCKICLLLNPRHDSFIHIQLVYQPHFGTKQGLVPWAINICMYCDVLWHRVLFWFHLMRYFTHQRKISKKYGPLFPRPGYGFSKWRQSYFEVVFNFLFSRATQEYCASKKEFHTSF